MNRKKRWTQEEINFLAGEGKTMSHTDVASFLNRTTASIQVKRSKLNVARKKELEEQKKGGIKTVAHKKEVVICTKEGKVPFLKIDRKTNKTKVSADNGRTWRDIEEVNNEIEAQSLNDRRKRLETTKQHIMKDLRSRQNVYGLSKGWTPKKQKDETFWCVVGVAVLALILVASYVAAVFV